MFRMIKRAQQKLVDLGKTAGKKVIVAGTAVSVGAGNAMAAGSVTVPTPDYTDFYLIVGVALGVTLIVGLARKGKSFLK